MKRQIAIRRSLLIFVLVTGVLMSVNAQRGYRRDNSRDYARAYRGGYSPAYRSYSYRSPMIGYRSPVIVSSPRPIVFGPRYYGVPHGSISISFSGNPYFYFGGTFYRPYGGYYRSVFPPIGIRIGILPFRYMPIYVGPDLFYFYNGIYYKRYDDRSYEVVDAPLGAQISALPSAARSVVVNGEKFYELNGTYYKEDRNYKGQVVYTVVGKNGHIDNTENSTPPVAPPAAPKTGDRVTELPDNCKTVVINGQKLYASPDDTYYRLETDGSYTIVGSAHENVL